MVLTFDANGSQAVTITETFLFVAQTTLEAYFCYVFCHNMTSTDKYRIRTYIKDENGVTTRLLYNDIITYNDIKDNPAYYIPPIPTNSFRVSIQKISGTDRTFTWVRGTF